jgi:hypothetical protein
MIELLLPCGFDTLEYSWVKATIGICTLADYSVAKKHQQQESVRHRGQGWEGRRARQGTQGTTTTGSASRSHSWRSRRSVMASWILGNYRAERLMFNILIEPLMCHHLHHAHDLRSKSTRSQWVNGNVPYFIHDVVKLIKPLMLHESI